MLQFIFVLRFYIGFLACTIAKSNSASESISTTIGCYADFYPTRRTMSNASIMSSSNTPLTCAGYCSSLRFSYSGTEYGNECYCSGEVPTIASTDCTMPCSGDSSEICGGINALSVVYTKMVDIPASNSTKRGLCWPWNNPASSFSLFSSNVIPWLYNWELWDPRGAGIYSTAEYVPMSRTKKEVSQVPAYFTNCYARHFLGFNEPDLPASHGGDYISPYEASVLWKQYVQPIKAKCGTILGAPGVTNGVGSGWGLNWLEQFYGNCTRPSCSFDFIPLHWYGNSLLDFQTHILKFHLRFPT